METSRKWRYCLAGATASGKTSVVHALAKAHHASILSADAMLVYRDMDIGTAKPTCAERTEVPYYGLDCVTPASDFSAGKWLTTAAACPEKTFVTGGTGLYFSVLLKGLDPTPPVDPIRRAQLEALPLTTLETMLRERGIVLADMKNPRRLVRALEIIEAGYPLPQSWFMATKPKLWALYWDRKHLHTRIAERVKQMYANGLLHETKALLDTYPYWSRTAAQAIGYAEALAVLKGTMSRAEAQERTIIRTRQLAKRQETYLRGQFDIQWIDCTPGDTLSTLIDKVAAAWKLT